MRIVVTGPECSGKSQLCAELAEITHSRWVKEYAREYLEKNGADYTYQDFIKILDGHRRRQAEALHINAELVFLDTDLINFQVWAERKYDKIPPALLSLKESTEGKIYFVCFPDLAWEDDPLRENKESQVEIYHRHLQLVKEFERPYKIIKGQGKDRLRRALDALQEFQEQEEF
ncbi:MAG: nicotinamide riboside kinase [Roseivirga sp.]|jgi:nicotinamide riboside kinase